MHAFSRHYRARARGKDKLMAKSQRVSAFQRWKAESDEKKRAQLEEEILNEMSPAQRQAFEVSTFKKPSEYMAASGGLAGSLFPGY